MPPPCGGCERKENEDYEPSEWFNHIWFLYMLQRAGYPFNKNDLTLEEWIDLGILKEELESLKWDLEYGK